MNVLVRNRRPRTIDELMSQARFKHLEDIVASVFSEMKPANRMSVTEAAEQFTRLGSGGGYPRPAFGGEGLGRVPQVLPEEWL